MTTLTSAQRSTLEKAVLKARSVAERGVRKRFSALQLTETASPADLPEADRALWRSLRRRAIALGQGRIDENLRGTSAVEAGQTFLVEELAYETWHRMLFARFLAENDLLVHPQFGPLSLADVRDLAAEDGADPWELAASFAADRLPGLFHLTVPLRLAREDRLDLSAILAGLDASVFTSSDALGWVYQFWQAQRKDEINAMGQKITGATLPPVTQLFTEDYIVDFLLQNSLGAWYAAHHPETPLKAHWPYLRYREDGTPAAGTFETWPRTVAEVTVMDPCCGSGHFLVAAFGMLVAMRGEEEGLTLDAAVDAVLRDNLYGLELDARCTQIATFAVALEAWKLGGHPETHLPQVACSGIPVTGQRAEWVRLAGGDVNLEIALTQLYELFSQASELGSLIDPKRAALMGNMTQRGQRGISLQHEWVSVERKLHQALQRERSADPVAGLFAGDDLVGTVRAAQLLSRTYTLVATNVPYLSRGSHGDVLKAFADATWPEAKNDLATLFLERCLQFVAAEDDARGQPTGAGTVAAVTPQNWLFLGAYKKLRQILLDRDTFDGVIRLGEHGFRSSQAAGAFTALVVLTATPPGIDHAFAGINAAAAPGPDAKSAVLQSGEVTLVGQAQQRENPDQRISLEQLRGGILLSEYADGFQGVSTGDHDRFRRTATEVPVFGDQWRGYQTTVSESMPYGGRHFVVNWEKNGATLRKFSGSYIRGVECWGKQGVVVSQMRELPCTLYDGSLFDNNAAVVLPKHPQNRLAIWAFCSSPEFNVAIRKIDSKLWVTNASLVKVPFDLEHWQRVADEQYPDGLPEPYSSDPTQWLFDGTVLGSDQPLQVALARLLGYRWPDQADDGLDALADTDGVVCLPSLNGEPPAHLRLRECLEAAYGDAWSADVLTELLAKGEAPSLEAWLRSGFFAQHVRLFHHRPFLWLITDGRRDGFAAIVNYHRLTANALSKLIYTYLGDWIGRQGRAVETGEAGAPARLEAATTLKAKLEAILEGEPPYDIYVRWKPLAEQPVGWNPDLNDGVRLNIRPFIEAGVLAGKVNAKWGKDRGADPAVRHEPLLAEATGDLRARIARHASTDRHNDLHFFRAEKERARELDDAGLEGGRNASR
jgi:hypothetical protein